MIRRLIKAALERSLRPSGYRLINPSHRYGIDVVSDVTRLARAWDVDVKVVFDVGANVGRTALAFRSAWPHATLYAFEPDREVARTLRAHLGSAPDTFIEEVALGAQGGRADFFVYKDSPDLNSLNSVSPYTDRFPRAAEAVVVDVTTLDAFCASRSVEAIGFLKIDTEGSDRDVLIGAERLLGDRRIAFICCEFNSLDRDPDSRGSLLPIADLLSRHGYHFVASYNDYVTTEGPYFAVSNALFAAGRRG